MIASSAGSLLIAGAVILFYTVVARGRPDAGVQELLAWAQVMLIMVFAYGGQAVLRDSQDRVEMLAYHLPHWVVYLPPGWLARFVDSCSVGESGVMWWILGATLLGVAGLWAIVVGLLSRAYARMEPGAGAWHRVTLSDATRSGHLGGRIVSRLTRPFEERAAFWLCSTMLRRDHDLRMRSWPSLGVVVALLLLGLFSGQLGDPMADPGPASALSLACIYLLATPIPTIVNNLNFSREHAASWLLWSSPVADRAAFAEGMRKAYTYHILCPILAVLLVVFAIVWRNPVAVLTHIWVGWLVIVGTGHAAQIALMRKFPFSAPLARGATFGPIAPFAAAVGAVVLTLAVVHYYAVRSTIGFVLYLVVLAIAVLALRAMSRSAMRKRFAVGVSYE